MGAHSLLKALSSEVNLQILTVLRSGSFHPRELARILQRDESDISRRLRTLERLGLVEGRWVRAGGKNVRVYSLRVGEIKIDLEPGELYVKLGERSFREVAVHPETRPEVGLFVGREEELRLLRGTKGVVVIYGMAGIGKTSLAAAAFSGAHWYSVTGIEDFNHLVWQIGLFLNALGWPALIEYLRGGGRDEGELFKLVLEGLNETGSTVVIDDLHRCGDEKIERLLSYIAPRLRDGRIAVTTRVRPNLGLDGVRYVHLKGLKPEEAYRLVELKGKSLEPKVFAELYGLTRGHPLAINLILESPEPGGAFEGPLFEFLFSEVYQNLSGDEKRMLSILAIFDEPVEYDALKVLYGKKNAFPVLYSLLRRGLVERRGDSYSLHELLRGFVRDVAGVDERAYYRAYSDYLAGKMSPADFLKAMKYAIASGDRGRVRKLVELRAKRMKEVVTDFPKAYLRILSLLPDEPAVKLEMGMVYFQRGLFEKAKRLWLEAEPELEGFLLGEVESLLVDVCIELGDMECAGEKLKALKVIAEELDDPYTWLSYHIERTKYEFYRDNLGEALESALRELEIVKGLGKIEEEPLVLLHIGDIYSQLEGRERAAEYYAQALELARAYGMRFLEHTSYMELAKAYYGMGRYGEAVENATRAVDYFRRIRNYRRAVDSIAYRCVSLIALERLDEAEEDAKELIRMAHSTGYPLGWSGYIFLGTIRELRGENGSEYFEAAREHLRGNEWLYEAVLDELEKARPGLKLNKSTNEDGGGDEEIHPS